MSDLRKKPGVAFWSTVTLLAVLLYVSSFGPAIWVIDHNDSPSAWSVDAFEGFYRPIIWIDDNGPAPLTAAIDWYIGLWRELRQPEYMGNQQL